MKVGRLVLLGLVTLIALFMGLNAGLWLIVPARAAKLLEMPLLTGSGLSSQMDIGAFFMSAATFAAVALFTRDRPWFIASAVMLLGAAAYRTVAFLFHGAPFLPDMVGIEVAMGTILIIASRVLGRGRESNG
ncbi:MAG: hypothetical protein NWP98_05750 [Erythrobacter sp.]|nr:hypothetical protein [Erythrobacter sp.]